METKKAYWDSLRSAILRAVALFNKYNDNKLYLITDKPFRTQNYVVGIDVNGCVDIYQEYFHYSETPIPFKSIDAGKAYFSITRDNIRASYSTNRDSYIENAWDKTGSTIYVNGRRYFVTTKLEGVINLETVKSDMINEGELSNHILGYSTREELAKAHSYVTKNIAHYLDLVKSNAKRK